MIEVGSVLLHEDVVKENFVCNLNKCKGACCLEGDSGAPLNTGRDLPQGKAIHDCQGHYHR
jgi:hypothetical protein